MSPRPISSPCALVEKVNRFAAQHWWRTLCDGITVAEAPSPLGQLRHSPVVVTHRLGSAAVSFAGRSHHTATYGEHAFANSGERADYPAKDLADIAEAVSCSSRRRSAPRRAAVRSSPVWSGTAHSDRPRPRHPSAALRCRRAHVARSRASEGSAARSMKSTMTSSAASTMSAPLAVLHPTASAAARNGVMPCPAITSPTNIEGVSSAVSTGSGSASSIPMGVALHTRSQPVGSGGPALTRPLPTPDSSSSRVATRESSAS